MKRSHITFLFHTNYPRDYGDYMTFFLRSQLCDGPIGVKITAYVVTDDVINFSTKRHIEEW